MTAIVIITAPPLQNSLPAARPVSKDMPRALTVNTGGPTGRTRNDSTAARTPTSTRTLEHAELADRCRRRPATPARPWRSPSTRKTGPGAATGGIPGNDDRSQASDDHDEEEDPPTDGRQLLGWAAKQVPDAKGRVISVGKKRGYPSRILDWTPQQVAAAYRSARALASR